MTAFRQLLSRRLLQAHLSIDQEIQEKLICYMQRLMRWNKVYNLTRISDPDEIITKHLIDSLVVSDYLIGEKIIDVGTGAGFPGIPLALINPKRHFVLLDCRSKKISFLIHVTQALGLSNVQPLHGRVETFHPARCFDTIVTRAWGSLNQFLIHTQHLADQSSLFLAMKGHYPKQELMQITPGFKVIAVKKLAIPKTQARHLVLMQRDKFTSPNPEAVTIDTLRP
jgi:16S rRNA (guanine527-N7)-methyltransferase